MGALGRGVRFTTASNGIHITITVTLILLHYIHYYIYAGMLRITKTVDRFSCPDCYSIIISGTIRQVIMSLSIILQYSLRLEVKLKEI